MAIRAQTRRIFAALACAAALALSSCGGSDILDNIDPEGWFNTKKKLPGERHEVFPGGVPGVPQGIPQDMVRGNTPPPGAESADTSQVAAPPVAEPAAPKAKPPPKRKAVARTKPMPASAPSSSVTVGAQPPPQQPAVTAPWPSQSAPAQAPVVAWPSAPPAAPQAAWPTAPAPATQ
jgi:hypothetical protein